MNKKILFTALVSLTVVATVTAGCTSKTPSTNTTPQQSTQQSTQQPAQQQTPAKAIDKDKVAADIQKLIDEKFPGDWKVQDTKLSKGSYTENDTYKIADAVAAAYPGSMVSVFVGQTRVSTSVSNSSTGKRALDYPVPPAIAEVMKNGKVISGSSTGMGSSMGSYQKVYVPFKSGDKTVAVMSISLQ
ncbi:MAG TPA: cache domain-containing protein [Bacillota bacterium]|nr:cache domain-containing protein [Bacillota bacterium]